MLARRRFSKEGTNEETRHRGKLICVNLRNLWTTNLIIYYAGRLRHPIIPQRRREFLREFRASRNEISIVDNAPGTFERR